jgi:hypothetical protein
MLYWRREEGHSHAGSNFRIGGGSEDIGTPSFREDRGGDSARPVLQTSTLDDGCTDLNADLEIDQEQYKFYETKDVDWRNIFE